MNWPPQLQLVNETLPVTLPAVESFHAGVKLMLPTSPEQPRMLLRPRPCCDRRNAADADASITRGPSTAKQTTTLAVDGQVPSPVHLRSPPVGSRSFSQTAFHRTGWDPGTPDQAQAPAGLSAGEAASAVATAWASRGQCLRHWCHQQHCCVLEGTDLHVDAVAAGDLRHSWRDSPPRSTLAPLGPRPGTRFRLPGSRPVEPAEPFPERLQHLRRGVGWAEDLDVRGRSEQLGKGRASTRARPSWSSSLMSHRGVPRLQASRCDIRIEAAAQAMAA